MAGQHHAGQFTPLQHSANIELEPEEERLYQLPPMSRGPVFVRAFDNFSTKGPRGTTVMHTGPSGDLQLELRHSQHLKRPGSNLVRAESLWHDDLWRLHVRRNGVPFDADRSARGYRLEVFYPSQLPVFARRIPAEFFGNGFATNWNQQQYVRVRLFDTTVRLFFTPDFAALYNLPSTEDTAIRLDVAPLCFDRHVEMRRLTLGIGAGPFPYGDHHNAPFVSIRAEFPAVDIGVKVGNFFDPHLASGNLDLTVRLFLTTVGSLTEGGRLYLAYASTVESSLIDALPESVAGFEARERVRRAVIGGLDAAQASESSPSVLGDHIGPWLIGAPPSTISAVNTPLHVTYEPGANDRLQSDGIVEPATGNLLVTFVAPKPPPSSGGVLDAGTIDIATDGSGGGGVDPDAGAPRLFDLPDEDPDPVSSGGGGLGRFGTRGPVGRKPDIGALSKIDHIVVLMQENRSFDQMLGYLSREGIDPRVDGLLPDGDPGRAQQVNRHNNRNYFPELADASDPPRARATAWPEFRGPSGSIVGGPCHDTACVRSQMNGMGGFVADFARRTGDVGGDGGPSPFLRLVMDYFNGQQLPVFDELARTFAISDRWYTSHPGPTWPNRYVMLTGDLNVVGGNIEEDIPDTAVMVPSQGTTIFDQLTAHGVPWRIYEHGMSFSRVFADLTFDIDNVVQFGDPVRGFEVAARTGALPAVTLIEPDYIDLPPGNDDHPPADVAGGQVLVERIVKALVDSPLWDRTLLVITYDEHGGFYDHRQPPDDALALNNGVTTLGPRVPAFFVSPLVAPRGVFYGRGDSGRFFDHTSIGATILRRFCRGPGGTPKMSRRMDAARDLRDVLTLDAPRPRTDFDAIRNLDVAGAVGEARSAAARSASIGVPDSDGDAHFLLSAIRLTVGQAPRRGKRKVGRLEVLDDLLGRLRGFEVVRDRPPR
jgi:hypothetical protein